MKLPRGEQILLALKTHFRMLIYFSAIFLSETFKVCMSYAALFWYVVTKLNERFLHSRRKTYESKESFSLFGGFVGPMIIVLLLSLVNKQNAIATGI